MAVDVSSSIEIQASPDAVWAVLTDFASYAAWNPFIDGIVGAPRVGARLRVHLVGHGGRGTTFRPTVTVVRDGQEFRWLGRLWPGRIFDGEHYFVLAPLDDGSTRLTHGERFSGVLVALMRGATSGAGAGFNAFNEALRDRVEAAAVPDERR